MSEFLAGHILECVFSVSNQWQVAKEVNLSLMHWETRRQNGQEILLLNTGALYSNSVGVAQYI